MIHNINKCSSVLILLEKWFRFFLLLSSFFHIKQLFENSFLRHTKQNGSILSTFMFSLRFKTFDLQLSIKNIMKYEFKKFHFKQSSFFYMKGHWFLFRVYLICTMTACFKRNVCVVKERFAGSVSNFCLKHISSLNILVEISNGL